MLVGFSLLLRLVRLPTLRAAVVRVLPVAHTLCCVPVRQQWHYDQGRGEILDGVGVPLSVDVSLQFLSDGVLFSTLLLPADIDRLLLPPVRRVVRNVRQDDVDKADD